MASMVSFVFSILNNLFIIYKRKDRTFGLDLDYQIHTIVSIFRSRVKPVHLIYTPVLSKSQ
jgi:hypothetical protein